MKKARATLVERAHERLLERFDAFVSANVKDPRCQGHLIGWLYNVVIFVLLSLGFWVSHILAEWLMRDHGLSREAGVAFKIVGAIALAMLVALVFAIRRIFRDYATASLGQQAEATGTETNGGCGPNDGERL